MEPLLTTLKASAEPTRLRILAVLDRCELTVGELCTVLGQTQPRVSRHLRLLCEAGLLDRHAEGTRAFYGPTHIGAGRAVFDAILPLVDDDDPVVVRDRARLAAVRAERAEAAATYFASVAEKWDEVRSLHVPDTEVERAMVDVLAACQGADHTFGTLLDIGTGTGRVLEVFADRVDRGIGIDLSREMLNLARTRLDEHGLTHCSVRHGNLYDLDVEPDSVDVAVLHHVLHFLDDPGQAITQAALTIRPDGRLLIVDFAPHEVEMLRTDYAHHRLGLADDEVRSWCRAAGLQDVAITHLEPTAHDSNRPGLTVTLWCAVRRADFDRALRLANAS